MSIWKYTDENGKKVTITGGQLKWLAQHGKITPETIIETEDGRSVPASKIKGLTFGKASTTDQKTNRQNGYAERAPQAESEEYRYTVTGIGFGDVLLKKYCTFSGRAGRQEFLSFFSPLFILVCIITGYINRLNPNIDIQMHALPIAIATVLAFFAVGLPLIALQVRRLHDRGVSGWWVLLNLIPGFALFLVLFLCRDGQPGTNRYGVNPKTLIHINHWKYINENGGIEEITNEQLKWLAKNGKITPETVIGTEDGKSVPARLVQGLFSNKTNNRNRRAGQTSHTKKKSHKNNVNDLGFSAQNINENRQKLDFYCNTIIAISCVTTACGLGEKLISYWGFYLPEFGSIIMYWSLYISFLCFFWRFVYTLWQSVPCTMHDRNPQSMAWFTVIPFFSLYGCFPAFCGLTDNINESARQLGERRMVEPAFSYAICCCWIFAPMVFIFLGIISDPTLFDPISEAESYANAVEAKPDFDICFTFLEILDTVFTCGYLLYLKNRMFAFWQMGS